MAHPPTTLQDFLKPLPGELKIPANLPEATVEITQFEDLILGGAALQRCGNCSAVMGLQPLREQARPPSRYVPQPRSNDFLKALPGELKITANFPEATVEITQFEDVKKAADGCVERTLLSAAFDPDL